MKVAQLIASLALIVTLGAAFVLRPIEPDRIRPVGKAISFTDRNGLPLGTLLGSDERHAIAVPLDRMSPAFIHAIVDAEDRRFFIHQAVDGRSLVRAFLSGLRERRVPHGGSTISMQLARLVDPVPATFAGKLREVMEAQRIENTLDKRAILEAYCDRVPMGSNLYGVEAAARTYFGTSAAELDTAQAALLAAIPNDPIGLDPYAHWDALKARQRYVLSRMAADGDLSPADARAAAREHVALAPRGAGIIAAAHFMFKIASGVPDGEAVVRTTIDRPLQAFVEAQTRAAVNEIAGKNVRDAAAIVIDNRSGETIAYAGSPDYFDDAALGRNDGVAALRQPGSTLKPFLYALALERGTIASNDILDDSPVAYALPGGRLYEPSDYSQQYLGPVRVRTALADSLNVPAVRVLQRLGVGALLDRLRGLGFAHLTRDPDYYGLGLALGGGEVSLDELAHAYAHLAQSRRPSDLLVTDILADPHARAASFGVDSILALPFPAAVKTGTSSGHRDTWTVGFTRAYTVGVWVGNFDGSAMEHVSGVSGAAPLWARIMLRLHEREEPLAFDTPPGYVRRRMCAATGRAPKPDCASVVIDYVKAGRSIASQARTAGGAAIVFPADGDRFAYIPSGSPQRIRLRFNIEPRSVTVDGRAIPAREHAYVWTVRPGEHVVHVETSTGETSVRFTVGPPLAPLHHGFTLTGAT